MTSFEPSVSFLAGERDQREGETMSKSVNEVGIITYLTTIDLWSTSLNPV